MTTAILLEDFDVFKKGETVNTCHKTYILDDFNKDKVAIKYKENIKWIPINILRFEKGD